MSAVKLAIRYATLVVTYVVAYLGVQALTGRILGVKK